VPGLNRRADPSPQPQRRTAMALTATSTIGSWLDDPRGAPIMEELLTGVELPDGALEQVKALPLQQLVALSQGKLLQSAVDDMVRAVNDGTIPEESPAAPADARSEERRVGKGGRSQRRA